MNEAQQRRRQEAIAESPSYRLAEKDLDFLAHPDLRPVRMQLELLKPEMTFREHGIDSTVVVFGGTQVVPKEDAESRVAAARAALEEEPDDPGRQRALQRGRRENAA